MGSRHRRDRRRRRRRGFDGSREPRSETSPPPETNPSRDRLDERRKRPCRWKDLRKRPRKRDRQSFRGYGNRRRGRSSARDQLRNKKRGETVLRTDRQNPAKL